MLCALITAIQYDMRPRSPSDPVHRCYKTNRINRAPSPEHLSHLRSSPKYPQVMIPKDKTSYFPLHLPDLPPQQGNRLNEMKSQARYRVFFLRAGKLVQVSSLWVIPPECFVVSLDHRTPSAFLGFFGFNQFCIHRWPSNAFYTVLPSLCIYTLLI